MKMSIGRRVAPNDLPSRQDCFKEVALERLTAVTTRSSLLCEGPIITKIGAMIVLLAGLAFGLLGWNGQAQAEGSRSLYPSGTRGDSAGCGTGANQGCRANLDIQPGNFYVGKINRRTFLYVYAQAGEYILLGSRNRSNGGDIFVYNPQSFGIPGNETIPGTANFTCSFTTPPAGSFGGTGKGNIADRAHELGGPNSADNSAPAPGGNGYVPCAYLAPSTGIYGVRFSAATSGGTDPNGSIGTPVVGSNTVSAWDVTVRANATSTTDINGRLFTYAWVAFTGDNSRPVFTTHYYVNSQGYRYSQQLRGLDPNGYVLYANSLGFLDNGQPLYKDIRGNEALVASVPLGVTTQIPQYPLFFNDVSDGGANATEVNRVLAALNIPLSPPSTTRLERQLYRASARSGPHDNRGRRHLPVLDHRYDYLSDRHKPQWR